MNKLLVYFAACLLPVIVFSTPRSRESFNDDWRFARFGPMPDGEVRDEPRGLQITKVDDSAWRELTLPHDWAIEGPFRQDLDGSTGKLPWRAIGWYRKTFEVPAEDSDKRVFIDFDGAMANAKVWLNGNFIGEWPYGYNSFRFELTEHLSVGGENTLAVRLDTTKLGSRWYPGAGIYRNVWLVKTEPVHIAHWGTYVTTPEITDEAATVRIRSSVENSADSAGEAKLVHTIHALSQDDEPGPRLARVESAAVSLMAGGDHQFDDSLTLANPKLWDLETPNRYLVRTEVYADGELSDRYDTPFGVRSIEFKADGFYLNGRKTAIQGVCMHHDLGPLGAAVNIRARERQFELLQEMGCNSVRTSHNPPEPELVELADKMGILLQVESFDSWHERKRENDYSTVFWDWWRKDVSNLVRHYRNHPSVFMWCSGNEIRDRELKLPSGEWLSAVITEQFHELDSTRPVTFGANGNQRDDRRFWI
jgi:beta-galactosidase